jgi:hypothetical protein
MSFAFLADFIFSMIFCLLVVQYSTVQCSISRRVRACTEATWCVGMYQLPTVTFTVITKDLYSHSRLPVGVPWNSSLFYLSLCTCNAFARRAVVVSLFAFDDDLF